MWADKDNKLLGKKIIAIEIADTKDYLKFITDSEPVFMQVEADCCSTSWIEHMSLPALPAVCLKIENVEMPQPSKEEDERHILLNNIFMEACEPEDRCLRFYGFKITTDKGYIDIEYRNSSNGFYYGWMRFVSDPDIDPCLYKTKAYYQDTENRRNGMQKTIYREEADRVKWLPIKEDF